MDIREILNKVIAEKYLDESPKLKALLDKNPDAKTEYFNIIKAARQENTEI